MRNTCAIVVGIALVAGCGPRQAEVVVPELPPYPLPAEVQQSLTTLADKCDVLILGETHGTQEVPAVVEALLAPLAKLGYRALALEVPRDQQSALVAWATGTTGVVPTFFANPGPDGRGNEQALALVRNALRPPYQWKLICFDATEAELGRQMQERLPKVAQRTIAELAAKLSFDDIVALSVKRDAMMANGFAAEREKLPTNCKVLAICGSLHARTADHAPADSPIKAFWPSFAAVLQRDQPNWKMQSINVQAFGGEYFNGGKLNKFSDRPLEKVEIRQTANADWDVELNLPRATAATCLQSPASIVAPPE
jgi:hypothetical protein